MMGNRKQTECFQISIFYFQFILGVPPSFARGRAFRYNLPLKCGGGFPLQSLTHLPQGFVILSVVEGHPIRTGGVYPRPPFPALFGTEMRTQRSLRYYGQGYYLAFGLSCSFFNCLNLS